MTGGCRGRAIAGRVVMAGATLGVVLAPMVVRAPRPDADRSVPDTVEALVGELQATGLAGWELVDAATRRVHQRYRHHSAWHLWDTPQRSLRHGHGQSGQFNQVLAAVLRGLGFDVRVVHAARVRRPGPPEPWFHAGWVWLRVAHDGHVRDVCAGCGANRAGAVDFHPVTPVVVVARTTRLTTGLALVPFVVREAWRGVGGRRPPRWLYRPMDA